MHQMQAELDVADLLRKQKSFFDQHVTKDIQFRRSQLRKLYQSIISMEDDILEALHKDFKKPPHESYMSEIGFCLSEIKQAIRKLGGWSRPRRAKRFWLMPLSSSKICLEPKGVVLVIAPWNYPFRLAIAPLIAAIAAGNCAIVKPSEMTPNTADVVTKLIEQIYEPSYITAVNGGREVSEKLLECSFDHIFFTGSQGVGKVVMRAAAEHLTPVTLELGGKCPCIVDQGVDIDKVAKRLVWGKFLNAGQTCVAPDHVLVHKNVKDDLVTSVKKSIYEFFGNDPSQSKDYARIVNRMHFERLVGYLANGRIVAGGKCDAEKLYIEPTLITDLVDGDKVMSEEIFGPILPIFEYSTIEQALNMIGNRAKPLAVYLFSNNKSFQRKISQKTSSGAVCFNDTIIHTAVPGLPFGGVGDSGMGRYHGRSGFETFSNCKTITKNPLSFDMTLRYPPYTAGTLKWIKRIFK